MAVCALVLELFSAGLPGRSLDLSHCDVRCMRHLTLTVLFRVIISFANLVLSTELMK